MNEGIVIRDRERPRVSGTREQTRARYPKQGGHVERDGQRLLYEVYGEGEETVFLLPTWSRCSTACTTWATRWERRST